MEALAKMAKKEWKIVKYRSISVYYMLYFDGGGMGFVGDYTEIVKKNFQNVEHLCEFACGPGFLGFALLANGLCKRLTLIDINPSVILACKKTVDVNHLDDVVTVYKSDVLEDIPKKEKWDLVIGNPPHFNGTLKDYKRDKIRVDFNWRIHKEFYRDVSNHLNANGSILLVENFKGSDPKIWKEMIGKYGLSFVKIIREQRSFYKLRRSLMSISLSLYANFKNRGKDIDNSGKLLINSRKLIHFIFPHYYVWSGITD